MSLKNKTRKFAGIAFSALLLGGCGGNYVWQSVTNLAASPFQERPPLGMTRQEISEIPYASMMGWFGKTQPALLILSVIDGQGEQWVGSDNVSVVRKDGRIKRTVGFQADLKDSWIRGGDPLLNSPHRMESRAHYQKIMEFRPNNIPETVVLDCTMENKGQETLEILELSFEVMRLTEKCDAKRSRWDYENTYWVDIYDGYVWAAQETFADTFRPLDTQILKPPAL